MLNVITSSFDGFELESVDGCRILVLNQFCDSAAADNLKKSPAYSIVNNAGEPVVVMSNDFYNVLDDDERMAIIYHEVGHHKAGHFANQAKYKQIDGVSFFPEHEADAYAISRVSKNAMRKSLWKLAGFMGKNTVLQCVIIAVVLITEPRRAVQLYSPF